MLKLIRGTWKWIGENQEQVKIVFVVVAGLYVLFEYRTKVHEARIDRAVKELSAYDASKASGAAARLDAFWLSDKVKLLRDEMKMLPAEGRAKEFHLRFARLVQGANVLSDVHQAVTSYRKLAICVNAGLCDTDTVCRFAFADVQGFRETYRGLLDEEFRHDGRAEIAHFAETDCVKQFRKYCRSFPGSPYCGKM